MYGVVDVKFTYFSLLFNHIEFYLVLNMHELFDTGHKTKDNQSINFDKETYNNKKNKCLNTLNSMFKTLIEDMEDSSGLGW